MTTETLYKTVLETTVHVASRERTLLIIGNSKEVVSFLIDYSFQVNDPIHVNACLLLQEIVSVDIEKILPHLAYFLEHLDKVTNESSKRLLSRLCYLLVKSKKVVLTDVQERRLVDIAMLWLVSNSKVATESFAMDILLLLSTKYKEDVLLASEIIEGNYSMKSVAYQNKAKKFLKHAMTLA